MKLTEHPVFAAARPSERARLIAASDEWWKSSGEWPRVETKEQQPRERGAEGNETL